MGERQAIRIKLPPKTNVPPNTFPFISPLGAQDLGSGKIAVDLERGGVHVGQVRLPILPGQEETVRKSLVVIENSMNGGAVVDSELMKHRINIELLLAISGCEVSSD